MKHTVLRLGVGMLRQNACKIYNFPGPAIATEADLAPPLPRQVFTIPKRYLADIKESTLPTSVYPLIILNTMHIAT